MTRGDGDNMLMRLSRRKSFIRGVLTVFVRFGLDCMFCVLALDGVGVGGPVYTRRFVKFGGILL